MSFEVLEIEKAFKLLGLKAFKCPEGSFFLSDG
jgi:hypothetical protein